MGILLVIALAQDLEEILRELRDERAEVRDRASAALTQAWERWSGADLARIEELRNETDLETAGRAADALATIRLRRSLGRDLLKHFPDLERVVRTGTAVERREILLGGRRLWRLAEADTAPVRALAETLVAQGFELEEEDELLDDLIPPYRTLLRAWLKRPERRWEAIEQIRDLDAREYLPELRNLLRDPDPRVRSGAACTLAAWGRADGIDVLLAQIRSEDDALVARAVHALVDLNAREHGPGLHPFIKPDRSPGLRSEVARALGEFGVKEAESALGKLLKDSDSIVRQGAMEALAKLDAKPWAPAILDVLPRAGGHELDSIKEALRSLGLGPLRSKLEGYLLHDHVLCRSAAWELLRDLDPAAPTAYLDHESSNMRYWAAWSLLESPSPGTPERWARLLSDPEPAVRAKACEGLEAVGTREHAEALVAGLVDRDYDVRGAAVRALGALQARDRTAAVAERLRDVHENTSAEAVTALGRLGARDQVGTLIRTVRGSSEWASLCAVEALGLVGAREAGATLTATLAHEDSDFRRRAVLALSELDLAKAEELIPLLEDRDEDVVRAALEGLAWIGTDDALRRVRALQDRQPTDVVQALLQSGRPEVLPWTFKALTTPHEQERRFAAEILARWTSRGLPVADLPTLATMLDRLELGGDRSTRSVVAAIRVGLGLRPPESLLPELGRIPQDAEVAVLCRAFAPEATAKLHRPFVPEKDIASAADLSEALRAAWGVKVEVSPDHFFPGTLPAGTRTTGMRLIGRLLRRHTTRASYIPSTGLIADGDVIRVVLESDALDFWRKRLEATK